MNFQEIMVFLTFQCAVATTCIALQICNGVYQMLLFMGLIFVVSMFLMADR